MAVQSNERGQVKDAGSDKADMAANQLLGRASIIEQTFNRLRLSNGCEVANIAFDTPNFSGDNKAGGAIPACNIFDPAGGGLNPEPIPADYLDTSVMPANYISGGHTNTWKLDFTRGTGISVGHNPNNGQLVLYAPYIKYDICLAINRKLGLNPPTYAPFKESWSISMGYHTAILSGQQANGYAFGLNSAAGKQQGCFYGDSSFANNGPTYWQPDGSYHFYTVIVRQ